ncbi:unnamed protein product, partial [Polarella glacialis]
AIEALELKMPESFSRAKMRLRITCPESLAEEIRQYLQESASARIDVDELLAASSAARTAGASSDAQIQEDASCTPAEGTGNGAEPVPTAGATVARSITFVCDPSHYRELDKLATVTHAGAGVQLQVLTAAVLEQAEPGVGDSGLAVRHPELSAWLRLARWLLAIAIAEVVSACLVDLCRSHWSWTSQRIAQLGALLLPPPWRQLLRLRLLWCLLAARMAQPGDFLLVRYDMPGPELWHERMVTGVSGHPGFYAIVTPDGDTYVEEVSQANADLDGFHLLLRQGDLPLGLNEVDTYRFGGAPFGPMLAQLLRNGAFMAAGHGPLAAHAVAGQIPAVAPPVPAPLPITTKWIVAESRAGLVRGSVIDPLPATAFTRGDRGIIDHGQEQIFIRQVPLAHRDTSDDLRVLPVAFDAQGIRGRSFESAISIMDDAEPEGGHELNGPRTALWVVKNMRDSGGSPSQHHDRWVRTSKVSEGDRSVYEHEVLRRVLESLVVKDQLNIPSLQGVEILVRRIQLIKEAHRISPGSPDYSAADQFLGSSMRRNGAAVDPSLQKFVAEELKAEAAIQKEPPTDTGTGPISVKRAGPRSAPPAPGAADHSFVVSNHSSLPGAYGRQRELFPLPLLEPLPVVVGFSSAGSKRSAGRRRRVREEANRAITALNELHPSPCQPGHPTQAQRAAQASILSQLSRLLGSSSGDGEVSTTVRPFDPALLSVPTVGTHAPSVVQVLDSVGVEVVEDFAHSMLLDDDALGRILEEQDPIHPYMDPILKNDKAQYHEFVHSLYKRGMLAFTSHARELVTPFCVVKKDGRLRLIFDCRVVNRRFRRPPKIGLGSGASWARLEIPAGEVLYTAQSDIKDYFYSLTLPAGLSEFFCLPGIPVELLRLWGVPEDKGGFAGVDGVCFPCLTVVPMGWSWAMWLAQRAHQHQALVGSGLSVSRLLVDGAPAPELESGQPVMLPYCDNLNVSGIDKSRVQQAIEGAVQRLKEVGFIVHEEVAATLKVKSLGYSIDGGTGVVSANPEKLERLIKGMEHLSRRPYITGHQLEHILGHAVHVMLLRREFLSFFRACYDFIQKCYEVPTKAWTSVATEAKWCCSLLRLCSANLRRDWDCLVTASDASLTGIAVSTSIWSLADVKSVGRVREHSGYKGKHPCDRPRQQALGILDPLTDVRSVLPPPPADFDEFELDPMFAEVPEKLLQEDLWRSRYSAQMHDAEKIGILECRGVEFSVRHRLRAARSFGKRCLSLGDNLGNVLGLSKGRFSAYPLLRVCRRISALVIAGDLQQSYRWIPSEFNAADKGSRKWEPKRPKAWWEASKEAKAALGRFNPPPGLSLPAEGGASAAATSRASGELHAGSASDFFGGDSSRKETEEGASWKEQPQGFPASVTFLEASAVLACANEDYDRRLGEYKSFLISSGLQPVSVAEIDASCVDFLHEMWEEGRELHEGLRLYSAFTARNPDFGRNGHLKLPRTSRAFTGWKKLAPSMTRPPMPWEFVCLIVVTMINMGQLQAALLGVLLFSTYCRPSEVLMLREKDLIEPVSPGGIFTIQLHPEEIEVTSKVGLTEESILFDSPFCAWLGPQLLRLKTGQKSAYLFPFEYHAFKKIWDSARLACQLDQLHYVPYQLRHGGPSHDHFHRLRSMLEIKQRGRWANDKTLKRYEAGGRLQQELQKASQKLLAAAQAAVQELGRLMSGRTSSAPPSAQVASLSSSSSLAAGTSRKRSPPEGWIPRRGTDHGPEFDMLTRANRASDLFPLDEDAGRQLD